MTAVMTAAERSSGKSKRQLYWERWLRLKAERESWISHYKDVSTNLLPRNGRFFNDDPNRGEKRHNDILDSTATRALRTLAAGLLAGASSPARPWFKLTIADTKLARRQAVKLWLDDSTMRILRVFGKSNTYPTLHGIYGELGAFGTGADLIVPNFNRVIHHYPSTVGEYAIALDDEGNVCTLYREIKRTVAQVVKQFGLKACSDQVQHRFIRGELDGWVSVIHAVEPRSDRDHSDHYGNRNMPWSSCYFELDAPQNDQLLSESGFKRFRAIVPRWDVAGGDIYGNSPGMEVLGDIRGLQHKALRKAQGIDQQSNPALQAPTSMKGQDIDSLPGGITYVDALAPQLGVRNLYDAPIRIAELKEDIWDTRDIINSGFFSDLFRMLINSRMDPKKTATEVVELHEEKLLMIGPVLGRVHGEALQPLVEMTFEIMLEAGALLPPPPELDGIELQVEFVSMLAQAQRAIGANGIDRFVGNLGAIYSMKPEVADKFDQDEWVDVYAEMFGVDSRLVIATDKAVFVRQTRAKAQAAKEQAALLEQTSKSAKNFATSPTGGSQNALMDLTNQFSGYGSPTVSEL